MRLPQTLFTLSVAATLSGCIPRQDATTNAKAALNSAVPAAVPTAAPVEEPNPMASFARMTSGRWQTAVVGGMNTFDTWQWGPSQHSIRVMTEGTGGDGKFWTEMRIFYWHPAHKKIHLLGFSPFARGISDGTITFDGETASGVFDIYQTGGRRSMALRWKFNGLDKYNDTLLEATGAGFEPLAAWDRIRSTGPRITPPPSHPTTSESPPQPSQALTPLKTLLGHTWEAQLSNLGAWSGLDTSTKYTIQSTFHWIASADLVYVRTIALRNSEAPLHLLDSYLYHHTGTNTLRCLALSSRGSVYEGNVNVSDNPTTLQLNLDGYEGEHTSKYIMHLDIEKDGSLHSRLWSLTGAQRTILLDAFYKK